MKKGLKIVAIAMVLVLVGSLFGCAKEEKAEAAPAVAEVKEVTKVDKDVVVTVPFPVGSATDVRARIIMEYASKLMGCTVTINNQPGAAGMIGISDMLARNSKSYELCFGNTAIFTLIPLFNKVPYTIDDIVPMWSTDAEQFGMFACPEKSGINNAEDMMNFPRRIKYATGAPGSIGHVMCATAMKVLGLEADHIVANGASVNLSECLGGTNDIAFAGLGLGADYVKEGRLVPVFTFNAEDYDGYEQYGYKMPSLRTLGGDFDCTSLMFFGARKDVPSDMVEFIAKCIHEALTDPECQEKLYGAGVLEFNIMDHDEILQYAAEQKESLRKYGQEIGLKVVE